MLYVKHRAHAFLAASADSKYSTALSNFLSITETCSVHGTHSKLCGSINASESVWKQLVGRLQEQRTSRLSTQHVLLTAAACICVSLATQVALNAHKVVSNVGERLECKMSSSDNHKSLKIGHRAASSCNRPPGLWNVWATSLPQTHFCHMASGIAQSVHCTLHAYMNNSSCANLLFQPLDMGQAVRRIEAAFFRLALKHKALQVFLPLIAFPVMGINIYL
jgi:hypothetical protein